MIQTWAIEEIVLTSLSYQSLALLKFFFYYSEFELTVTYVTRPAVFNCHAASRHCHKGFYFIFINIRIHVVQVYIFREYSF